MKRQIEPRRAMTRNAGSPVLPENRAGNLRLDMNENLFGSSPRVRAALRRLDTEALAMYPEKGVAIARMAPRFGVRVEEMLLTAGIDEALHLIADAYLERGRSVLLVEPTFPMYRFFSGQSDARVRALRYDAEMRFPLADVLGALREAPSIFFLANPNNPTGTLLGLRELGKILDAGRRTLVVVDEAYFDYCGVTALPWIRRRRNLIVTRTFSKATGLAGLRLGCIFAHREIAEILRRAQAPYPVSVAALAAAAAALRDRQFVRRNVAAVLRNRAYLARRLARLGVRTVPSAASFALADFGRRGTKIVAALARKRILLRDFAGAFGRPGPVRITVGTRAQLDQLLRALEPLL
jgi:histidinol-phosphate aminotransferase